MAWYALDNKEKVMRIVNYLIHKGEEIEVRFKGQRRTFFSKFIKIEQGNGFSNNGGNHELIMEKLNPEEGNFLIQSVYEVVIGFLINENLCRYSAKYMGISNTSPHFGFIVSFPESIQYEDRRKEERITHKMPELFSVKFRLGKGAHRDKVYDLNVLNRSRHGLGLLITEKDFDLLRTVNVGDHLYNMMFLARSALIRVNGIVRHKTKIWAGKYRGCYVMGIESPDIIDNPKPNRPQG
jgi:hypothetical protein